MLIETRALALQLLIILLLPLVASNGIYNATGPYIELNPAIGPPGTSVTVSGGHFSLADKTCVLSTNAPTLLSSPDCNMSGGQVIGSFTVSDNAPAGTYSVQVAGDQGDFAQWPFTVQSNQVSSTTTTLTYPTTSVTTTVVQVYSTSMAYATSMYSSTTTTTQTFSSTNLAATSVTETTSTSTTFVTSLSTQTSIVTRTSEVAVAPNTTTTVVTSVATSYLTGDVTTTSTQVVQSTSIITTGLAIATITSTLQTLAPTYVPSSAMLFWILGVLLLVAVAIMLVLLRGRVARRSVKCAACGNENPPYARSFCVRCGAPLSDRGRGNA